MIGPFRHTEGPRGLDRTSDACAGLGSWIARCARGDTVLAGDSLRQGYLRVSSKARTCSKRVVPEGASSLLGRRIVDVKGDACKASECRALLARASSALPEHADVHAITVTVHRSPRISRPTRPSKLLPPTCLRPAHAHALKKVQGQYTMLDLSRVTPKIDVAPHPAAAATLLDASSTATLRLCI